MIDRPSWDHLATFLSVMGSGSLSAAARNLRLSQPTIRRHVDELERQLGVALFTRSPNGLIPTANALALVAYAQAMEGAADALVRAAKSDAVNVAGTVRVTCSEVMAGEIVPGILAPLLRQHAALNIEIVASDRMEDLLQRRADVAIRMVRPVQAALVARKLGDVRLGLFASKQYLEYHEQPIDINGLVDGHSLIGGDRDDQLMLALAGLGLDPNLLRFAIRTDSGPAQVAAIRAGVGIGVCQIGIAARDASLVRIISEHSFALPVWIVMHEDLRHQPSVRAVYDHLAKELLQYSARVSSDADSS
ncbi:LysR family transcriptional regulator [Novosphingobium sp.]|uniref:LysR family transcriptional regulator n=1 Tax=Novosphingobium sp. TaxID=1874826 RepID=UPI003BA8629A